MPDTVTMGTGTGMDAQFQNKHVIDPELQKVIIVADRDEITCQRIVNALHQWDVDKKCIFDSSNFTQAFQYLYDSLADIQREKIILVHNYIYFEKHLKNNLACDLLKGLYFIFFEAGLLIDSPFTSLEDALNFFKGSEEKYKDHNDRLESSLDMIRDKNERIPSWKNTFKENLKNFQIIIYRIKDEDLQSLLDSVEPGDSANRTIKMLQTFLEKLREFNIELKEINQSSTHLTVAGYVHESLNR